jgi:hypothetical protein
VVAAPGVEVVALLNADVWAVTYPDAALHPRMGTPASSLDRTGEQKGEAMADPDLAAQDVIDALGSSYSQNVRAALWADAVANRLEGLAIYLLSGELPEVAIRVELK